MTDKRKFFRTLTDEEIEQLLSSGSVFAQDKTGEHVMTRRQTTIGEYRVGITFNPSGDDTVTKIKTAAAALIDLIDGIRAPDPEVIRLKALAMTALKVDYSCADLF